VLGSPPHFDPHLHAWILRRHADVAEALHEPRLSIGGDGTAPVHGAEGRSAWRAAVETSVEAFVTALPFDEPIDLVRDLARPWSLALAVRAAGARPTDADALERLAREIFLAAACATDATTPPHAQAAVAALATRLAAHASRGDLAVQAFVALSQTLPCFLAGAWRALFEHPDAARALRVEPALMGHAVEELLRHAGPSHAVFRRAAGDVEIGGVRIAAGDRVILMLAEANRDPSRFPNPNRLDLTRSDVRHVALGAGMHPCIGGAMVRAAVAAATGALLRATTDVELDRGEVEWIGGFAIRGPGSLRVVLRRPMR
jgi:cytochrome P450